MWLKLGTEAIAPDDIELFGLPENDLNGGTVPVPEARRFETVSQAFGSGRALVINSLHRWCPKANAMAAVLNSEVGLPIDVYMYLTPPFSASYGLHSDVMDALMVRINKPLGGYAGQVAAGR